MPLKFPLTLRFKIVSLASKVSVRDATGRELLYVHQKLLKLKESITAYSDAGRTRALFRISADRVMDFRARYEFTDAAGKPHGAVTRQGARSLWRATYDVYLDGTEKPRLRIREERPWVKLLDSVLGEIPVFGILTGYFLNPTSQVVDVATGKLAYRVAKRRALFESRFLVDRLAGVAGEAAELAVVLAIVTVTLLERSRG